MLLSINHNLYYNQEEKCTRFFAKFKSSLSSHSHVISAIAEDDNDGVRKSTSISAFHAEYINIEIYNVEKLHKHKQ